jgi:hypothetical protein
VSFLTGSPMPAAKNLVVISQLWLRMDERGTKTDLT